MRAFPLSIASLFVLSLASSRATAQCLEWSGGLGPPGQGANGDLWSLAAYDLGAGPRLGLGGNFQAAGTVAADGIASWEGASWSAFGAGLSRDGQVGIARAWSVFDDGGGPALYVAGEFTHAGGVPVGHIARWDGSSWSSVGGGLSYHAYALAVYDDGSGPALYVGGDFAQAGGQPIARLARWNGSSFSSVGAGVVGSVYALAVFDGGAGPELVATGALTAAGGMPVERIAKWNGVQWSTLGSGVSAAPDQVGRALAVFDDGSGPALYLGGNLPHAGSAVVNGIARWDGSAWSALGSGLAGYGGGGAWAIAGADLGFGPRLYVAGPFLTAGGVAAAHIAAWDGSSWSALGSGLDDYGLTLAVYDGGAGPALYAGGLFSSAGGLPASHVARWDGGAWSALGRGGLGASDEVLALATADFGQGAELFAGGRFGAIGSSGARAVSRWTGSDWASLGAGIEGEVHALTAFTDGGGSALYAGGSFTEAGGVPAKNVARWDGTSWSALGTGLGAGVSEEVSTLAPYDDGTGRKLYAGGRFLAVGGQLSRGISRWNGSAWEGVAGGLDGAQEVFVNALVVHDDGSGQSLFLGGRFSAAGGVPAANVARWDGASWTAVGAGFTNDVRSLVVHDDGSGPKLYAAGSFSGSSGWRVSRWDGASWTALGDDQLRFGAAYALASFDDGSGPALHAAGAYSIGIGGPFPGVARWNGASWLTSGSGILVHTFVHPKVLAVHDFDGDGARDLVVGGRFGAAGGHASSHLAVWRGCEGPGERFCFGEAGAAACPCANTGAYERGCDNSSGTGGARLFASGTTSPDTVVLAASGELASALTIFLQGDAELAPGVSFGDGVRCVGGALKRLAVRNASAGSVSFPNPGDPSITTQSALLGDPIAPGSTRFYQTYYRDPVLPFCPSPSGNSFNASHALRIGW